MVSCLRWHDGHCALLRRWIHRLIGPEAERVLDGHTVLLWWQWKRLWLGTCACSGVPLQHFLLCPLPTQMGGRTAVALGAKPKMF